ncbi:uncharacterized protein LOC143599041 [Bidens hawaiensis]|uniref:uncharacterized protein LOC143599041 n=1 Tax=Bidens hawaiensis TaxID=980011 RepID=UPI00404A1D57
MEEEGYYFPVKLKRKNLEEANDDFSLASPATKMRRLDAELPPVIKEEEMVNPVTFAQPEPSNTIVDDLSHTLPVKEERAIVLYDPVNNIPLLQSRSPFSFTVNSDFLSGFKNRMFWSNRSQALESLNGINEEQENNNKNDADHNNGSLAVVPWVPMHSNRQLMAEVENNADEVSEMMDVDDMDVEGDDDPQQVHNSGFGSVSGCEGVNQWQQHCMVPQAAHSLSAPVGWSGTGV